MDSVALTPYHRPESAFNLEALQEVLLCRLPQLLLYSPSQTTAATSTVSSLEAIIHSMPVQIQPQRGKEKAPAQSQGPTLSTTEF